MGSQTCSVILWCVYDPQTDTTQLQIVRTDTAEVVYLNDATFLLRISIDEHTKAVRCFIRHIASGRDAYVQGGPKLHAFIKACLLKNGEESAPAASDMLET